MASFTKGKWGFFRNGDGTFSITGNGGQVIGECFTGDFGIDVEDAEANAVLIAYAPKMYELLKAMTTRTCNNCRDFKQQARILLKSIDTEKE